MVKREPLDSRAKSSESVGRPKGTIVLNRNAEGILYFSARIDDNFVRWLVYPNGERWLRENGYGEHDKITGGIVHYLRKNDLIYTLKPKVKQPPPRDRKSDPIHEFKLDNKPRSRLHRIWMKQEAERQRKLLEASRLLPQQPVHAATTPDVAPHKSTPGSMPGRFDWGTAVDVEQRLGKITANTSSIHADGTVEHAPDIQSRRATPARRKKRD